MRAAGRKIMKRKKTKRADKRSAAAAPAPAQIGAISDQLCDVEYLARGGMDACFGVEHISADSQLCSGPRAIFEAIERRVAEIKTYADDIAEAQGKAVRS